VLLRGIESELELHVDAICSKTAYPLESVTALDKSYHKACFKCTTCKQSLNLKNFKGYEGKIYCFTHTPKPNATTVTDSVALKNALNAPKKTSEGLGVVQKGTGGKPNVAAFGGDGSAPAPVSSHGGGEESYDAGGDAGGGYEQSGYEQSYEGGEEAAPEYSEEAPAEGYEEEQY